MRTMDDLTLQYVLPLIIAVGEIGLIKEHSRALAGQYMHMLAVGLLAHSFPFKKIYVLEYGIYGR